MDAADREKQLDKIFKDIGERVEQQMKEANARLKSYYESQYNVAVREAETALSMGDTVTALFYQQQAKLLSDALRTFGS